MSRSTSSTSSLDPYYFGAQSDSPMPPLPHPPALLSVTPNRSPVESPVTPARDPASIDRRGLIGVGDLTTPRWSKTSHVDDIVTRKVEPLPTQEEEENDPDSPWTIEAVDGESSGKEDRVRVTVFSQSMDIPRPLRGRASLPEESGGEEILYPRKPSALDPAPELPKDSPTTPRDQSTNAPLQLDLSSDVDVPLSPPSAFSTPGGRRAKKRTSDEFEMDQAGVLISKRSSMSASKEKSKEASARRHRSLNISASSREKGKDRRRESSGISLGNGRPPSSSVTSPTLSSAAKSPERHVRQTSLTSSGSEGHIHNRRVHTTDFSHLPPSPSSNAIQQFLKQPHTSPPLTREPSQSHSSPNVAHSLLRGTQEGWSGLDDEATAEALRKLDGISGKTARARASVGSFGRPGSSRPSTPGKSSTQWEGISSSGDNSKSRSGTKEKESPQRADTGEIIGAATSGDEQQHATSSSSDRTPKKGARSSLSAKRGSTSSTNYTGTPSSRDSASMSATTSITSMSATSSSDTSNHSGDAIGEAGEDVEDLSSYKSPPNSSAGLVFPPRRSNEEASHKRRPSQQVYTGETSSSDVPVTKTPSKKWSFSNALNIKLSNSPPRTMSFGQQIRKSTSKEQSLSPSMANAPAWSPVQNEAMTSASSSIRTPGGPSSSKTPERGGVPSRSGTDSSASTNHASTLSSGAPLSPSSSVRRNQSKRLTPSSIPFFRRSSSQSMQMPPPPLPSSPTSAQHKVSSSPPDDYNPPSTSAHKKSSMMSLGFPSLLKGSSSRRSLHSDSNQSGREPSRSRDSGKEAKPEKEKKKEDKEGRISVLMGRKRGKTLSSTDPRKPKEPVAMPPMQIAALEPATAQRVARLKAGTSLTSTPTSQSTSTSSSSSSRSTAAGSRLTSQTSDSSLRSRNQLPTIAGSPSTVRDTKEGPPASFNNSISGLPKETPTKIPRISSRTSGIGGSPTLKGSTVGTARRTSVNVTGLGTSPANPSPIGSANEFGVIEGDGAAKRSSPTTTSSVSRNSSSSSILPRNGLRKSSTSSVASGSASQAPTESTSSSSHHRFSALSPPKISLPRSSSSSTPNIHQSMGTPSSSRQSLSTPSPSPTSVDEEELLGDEEMMHYIRRQQAKKLSAGASQVELDGMLAFPEPIAPGIPSSPSATLKSSQSQYLSEYEKKEILDYPSVYCVGARSKKKMATVENSTNNYGYDDDRGDYLVINHDHLAYRYEVIDTLGKGSFGQVLHCRDHCTGESVAIKIIRNKKRFHHQALVEIKILDNLRKWDSDERHHVIKMTEHFYFRNHLCIAMELLSINLYELIKANGFVGFTTTLIRRFTSQMLMSLSLMRHHRIVHCDLKPENVLLKHPAKSAIKVIDFGSSCFEHEKSDLGCILAELYTGFPIFPGENEQEQLSCIMEVLGVPDKDFVNRSSRKKLFFDPSGVPRPVVNSKGRRRRPGTKSLQQVLRCTDENFVDFIAKCLVWDPERRIKPQAALRHPFVTGGQRPKTPPTTKANASSSSLSSRSKIAATPKKSQISAPTPLTARSSRTNGGVPTTPSSSSNHASTLGSARPASNNTTSLSSCHSSSFKLALD
ncbi:hypothetical protein BD626DRAFT_550298 [Schizophyllum amplum]|uniref:dual-specificity kinase n=1 Tax=Schizophyllum amplum TaxID=97359 RepID=A0A550C3T3_9AGAR|nr:hypothetical protein BD626DRAFT_550298 [Auriculariopsis ampla]